MGDQWDTVMNYDAFMEPITWFLCGVEKHSDEFRGDLLGNYDALQGCDELPYVQIPETIDRRVHE